MQLLQQDDIFDEQFSKEKPHILNEYMCIKTGKTVLSKNKKEAIETFKYHFNFDLKRNEIEEVS